MIKPWLLTAVLPDIPPFLDRRPRAQATDPTPRANPEPRSATMAARVQQAGERRSNLTADTFLYHLKLAEKNKADADEKHKTWKAADGVYRAGLKAADEDGVNQKVLLKIMKRRKGDQDQFDLDLRDEINYANWAGCPITPEVLGTEAEDGPSEEAQEELDEHDWDAAGYSAGLASHSLESCPYDPGSEAAQVWSLGWKRGQQKLLEDGPQPEKATKPKRGSKATAADGSAVH